MKAELSDAQSSTEIRKRTEGNAALSPATESRERTEGRAESPRVPEPNASDGQPIYKPRKRTEGRAELPRVPERIASDGQSVRKRTQGRAGLSLMGAKRERRADREGVPSELMVEPSYRSAEPKANEVQFVSEPRMRTEGRAELSHVTEPSASEVQSATESRERTEGRAESPRVPESNASDGQSVRKARKRTQGRAGITVMVGQRERRAVRRSLASEPSVAPSYRSTEPKADEVQSSSELRKRTGGRAKALGNAPDAGEVHP